MLSNKYYSSKPTGTVQIFPEGYTAFNLRESHYHLHTFSFFIMLNIYSYAVIIL